MPPRKRCMALKSDFLSIQDYEKSDGYRQGVLGEMRAATTGEPPLQLRIFSGS